MPGFKIENFKGKVSKVTPRLLAEGFAVEATNCEVSSGDIEPIRKPLFEHIFTMSLLTGVSGANAISSIFLYAPTTNSTGSPTAVTDNLGYWFNVWGADVDFISDFTKNDPLHIIYTDSSESDALDTYPKYTNLERAISTVDVAPANHYPLGIPAPSIAPAISDLVVGTGEEVDKTTVYYVYTFVDSEGRESAPSPVSTKHEILPGGEVAFSLFSDFLQEEDYIDNIDITGYRIYASTTGSSGSVFLRCHGEDGLFTELNGGVVTVSDDLTYRGDILETQTWLFPHKDMIGITPMPNGIMAGFIKDTKQLVFSEPYVSYAYPAEYDQILDSKIVGLGMIGDSLFVGTTGMPYLIAGAHPSAFSVSRLDFEQACLSKRSIVNIMDGLLYACPDGLMFVSPSGSKLATEDIISRDQWQLYNPKTIHAYQHENKYFGFYYNDAEDSFRGFIFNIQDSHFIDLSFGAIGGYRNIYDDTLYLVDENNEIMKWAGDSTKEEYTWKSKVYRTPYPVNFGAAQIIAEGYPIKFSLIVDDVEKITEREIDSSRGFRLPAGFTGRDWQVSVVGSHTISAIRVSDTLSELGAL